MVVVVLFLTLLSGLLVALHKRRRLVHAVRDRAFLPGHPGIWHSEWFQIPAAVVCAEDIDLWPYTPGLLVKWVSFLNSLHWPAGDLDLGVGGVSYVELLIMYELLAGERLSLDGSLQLLDSSHVRERDKALLRGIMVGGVWNGFFLSRVPFLLLLRFVKILSFMIS